MLLQREIEARLRALLLRVAAGDDVPPGLRMRLEGLMEAAVLMGAATPESLHETLDGLHGEILGAPLAASLGDRWTELYPFPELPVFMQRAPVFRGTGD